ncbi:hypothetical protein GCM10025881_18370 [Pseudolysinimonas kribbensis]|uniref:Uncharacterized protein n=1 Tax=Pseudolysinimonas kribbensis TaxID=433641 RepID=A0ABQ6K636_9MICO|nr:hypothetical protein [Pseudolysinimonas kribbensis]GMA95013.1 hypothetical protein GCM10025881_18370 [Pseudolysinimonas kribbensis]
MPLARTPAPLLEAPPGQNRPSGATCEYTPVAASTTSRGATALITSVVPSTPTVSPSRTAPVAICPVAPSVIPDTITTPVGRPQSAGRDTSPITRPGPTRSGRWSRGIPTTASAAASQAAVTGSIPLFSACEVSEGSSRPASAAITTSGENT